MQYFTLFNLSSSFIFNLYYRPNISSSITTRKRPKLVSGGSAGDAGTSRAMGRGVAKSYNVIRLSLERENVGI